MTAAAAPSLRALQQWLAHVMRHPATAAVAVRSAAARRLFALPRVLAGEVVVPNARMTVTDRLQVYNGGYLARLQEVLATDYGGLQRLVGDDAFQRLCARYVDRHPSRHPNLNRFGKQLPAFVRTQRWLPQHAFAVELAQLECAISDAFDAEPFTPLAAGALAGIPPAAFATARLHANPSLRLCAFRHPVNDWYVAWKEERPVPRPRLRRSHTAVFRRDYRVYRLVLEPSAFAVLSALVRGEPLGRALARARGGDVQRWFATWSADGLFTGVQIAAPRSRR